MAKRIQESHPLPDHRRNTHPKSRHGQLDSEPDWLDHLAAEWLNAVDPPLYFEQYSEYEIRAERAVGFDADDQPCFTSHRYLLTDLVSDDDDSFYEVVAYCEEMAAWRLRDGRWLVYRRNSANRGGEPRSFYTFSQSMPR